MPKDGSSPAVERRTARGIRRNIRRKRFRLDKLKSLLQTQLLEGKSIVFQGEELIFARFSALEKKEDYNTIARIVYSLAKHRGFKSNRKAELKDGDTGKLNNYLIATNKDLTSYRTIAEMYCKDERYHVVKTKIVNGEPQEYIQFCIRNRNGSIEKTLPREKVIEEIEIILTRQKELGNNRITDDFISKVVHIVSYQKSYDEGPDLPSPYHVNFNVGSCTFFKDEKRAPKASFSYEYFTALCDINNLKINGEKLTQEQRQILINAFLKSESIKYEKVAKLLNLTQDDMLSGKSGCDKAERVFIKRSASYQILKALDLEQDPIKYQDLLDEIGYTLSMFKSDERRMAQLSTGLTQSLTEEQRAKLIELDFSKFGNLSIKALKCIIPYLEEGCNYTDACEKAGLKQAWSKGNKLEFNQIDGINDITSPVSKRAISQTIKVVNAIIRKYGEPNGIHVELAREFGRNFKDRKKLEKQINANFQGNEKLKERLKSEFGVLMPSGQDILKLKLYEEQQGKCIYSGKNFESVLGSVAEIFKNNNTQIDHIIPYSRCYDDSFNNKVLVLSSENQKKGNRTPYEYFGADEERWNQFVALAYATYSSDKKKKNPKLSRLLMQKLDEGKEKELGSRALNDTRFISVFVKNMFERHLVFDKNSSKRPVKSINGGMTSFMRKIWGLKKERFADDKHHAVDAVIVACVDEGLVMRVTKYLQQRNLREIKRGETQTVYVDKSTGEIVDEDLKKQFGDKYYMPYPCFKEELLLRMEPNILEHKEELAKVGYQDEDFEDLKPLNVSRMVNHKVTGAMHDQTIRSKKLATEDRLILTTKTSIKELKLDKNGEIKDYPLKFRNDDRLLYEALKARLQEFGGNGEKAFAQPFYKPTKHGATANEVKSVKLQKIINDGVEVNGGIAENSSMIRIDIFTKGNKNYFIPVYVKDYYDKKLPTKIAKAGKPYKEWSELDENYDFKFSLFPNDLVYIKSTKGVTFLPRDDAAEKEIILLKEFYAYYKAADRSTATLEIESVDGKLKARGVGIQTLERFDKYEIDILGNITPAPKENRKEFK